MRFNLDLPAWKWPFYVARHPFEGYEDLRWKKGYSMRVALVIVLCFFITSVCRELLSGFLFGGGMIKLFNVVPHITSTVLLFFIFVIANWALCTLFDGEGTMKNICCISAYALVPYIISQTVNFIVSNYLTRAEYGFLVFVEYLGLVWSVVLIISGMKTVHQYSVPKTLIALAFTVLAMIIILFVAILIVTMFQQVFVFGYSVYTELLYRFSL